MRFINDITSTKADFIVDEQEYRATQRRAMFDAFSEIIKTMDPETSMQLLDLMFEYSDLPGREEIVSRIRKLNGQSDPKKKNDPEEVARAEQEAQEAAMMKEFEMRRIQLELAKMEAEAGKISADTEKTKAETISTNVEALYQGIQVGTQISVMPTAAMIADEVVASAGYVDKNAAPVYPQDVRPVLPPMTRQERTIIQKQMGVESDKDGNPMTPDKASNEPSKTSKTNGKKGIIKPGAQ